MKKGSEFLGNARKTINIIKDFVILLINEHSRNHP